MFVKESTFHLNVFVCLFLHAVAIADHIVGARLRIGDEEDC